MRWAAKVDANHAEIVRALRQVGAGVLDTSRLGKGAPDLIVAYRGYAYLVEVKSGKGKLTPDQVAFQAQWPGRYAVVRSVDDALRAIGAISLTPGA